MPLQQQGFSTANGGAFSLKIPLFIEKKNNESSSSKKKMTTLSRGKDAVVLRHKYRWYDCPTKQAFKAQLSSKHKCP